MEEENQAFGKNAEAADNNINLESEDFCFYNQNKEEAKKNIDSSSKDLTDFIDSLIKDIPAPSPEEVNAGIEKILERTHPTEKKQKTDKKKKVTFRVLFIAALLSILSFSGLYVVGSSHNISIENGFVTFAKDTIRIVFFGEENKEYITIDTLLTDLEAHGYEDVLLPERFITNYDEYKVSVPEYLDGVLRQASFNVVYDNSEYTFVVHKYDKRTQTLDYKEMENVKTVVVDDIHIYVSDFGNEYCLAEFKYERYRYSVQAKVSYDEMVEFIKTINKVE